ncbi:MAG: molecular chaperone DnaJ [Maricaulis sp.]|jgi:DnaJ-domain-containing protein 1|nr:molecular chaperone DnaJ [Maricaulis sp.]HAQ34261.1 molecular chaperone DnaJ [Alphaproteobacteria bacterium]
MPFLLAGLVLIIAAWFGLRAFARMTPQQARKWSRVVMGAGAVAFGGLMTLRGLAVFGVPLVGVGLGLLGVAFGVRAKPRRGSAASPPTSSMSRAEALEILGLSEGVEDDAIRAAYRSQMKRNHPDTGGSPALARRIRDARDVLLND